MNFRLKLINLYIPAFIRRRVLLDLFRRTARAFCVSAPTLPANNRDILKSYARFTHQQACTAVTGNRDVNELEQRLFEQAYQMGSQFRRRFKTNTKDQALSALQIIYRLLKIDLEITAGGDLEIKKCYFSQYYSAKTCSVISALDRGLVSGLTDGAHLVFIQKITQNNPCCLARIYEKETK